MQFLVYPGAARVLRDTTADIQLFSSCQKAISRISSHIEENVAAFATAGKLLELFKGYLTHNINNTTEMVSSNQTLMTTLGVDKPVRSFLNLHLGCDSSRQLIGDLEADVPSSEM